MYTGQLRNNVISSANRTQKVEEVCSKPDGNAAERCIPINVQATKHSP